MRTGNLRRKVTLFAALAALLTPLVGCDALSTTASCEEYVEEFESLGNPKALEMVRDAYFEKFPDEESVSGAAIAENIFKVRQGCAESPEAKIDQFIEIEE